MKRALPFALLMLASCWRNPQPPPPPPSAPEADDGRGAVLFVRWTGGSFSREYHNPVACDQAMVAINQDNAARIAAAESAYRDDPHQPAVVFNATTALCIPR